MRFTAAGTEAKAHARTGARAMLCLVAFALAVVSWHPVPDARTSEETAARSAAPSGDKTARSATPSRDFIRSGATDRRAIISRLADTSGDDMPAGLQPAAAAVPEEYGRYLFFVSEEPALRAKRYLRPEATGPPAAL